MMRPKPNLPTFDAVVAAIRATPSLTDLAAIRVTATTYFMGTQREELEAAANEREAALSVAEA